MSKINDDSITVDEFIAVMKSTKLMKEISNVNMHEDANRLDEFWKTNNMTSLSDMYYEAAIITLPISVANELFPGLPEDTFEETEEGSTMLYVSNEGFTYAVNIGLLHKLLYDGMKISHHDIHMMVRE